MAKAFHTYSLLVARDMRDLLIEHLDGKKVPFVPRIRLKWYLSRHKKRHRAHNALIATRSVKVRDKYGEPYTVITDLGRETLAILLADYADAIVRVGHCGVDQISKEIILPSKEAGFPDSNGANGVPHGEKIMPTNKSQRAISARKRKEWRPSDVRSLKALARRKTPAPKIAKQLRRTVGATRQKAFAIGVSLESRF